VTYRVIDTGDSCVTLELEARIDPRINDACLAIADRVAQTNLPGVRDVVATYHTVAVHFDPLHADRRLLAEELVRSVPYDAGAGAERGSTHEVPTCYGGEFGPDLTEVAGFAGCSEEEVVRLHSERTYRVYMMGFLPGFAYMGSVNPRIGLGRRDTPRLRVAAGSVGIAGLQTGIYPLEAPAGWRIIGRTWVRPLNLLRSEPWLFRARDAVRFVPVSREAYRDAVAGTSDDDAR
jgi:inhibitor of KinA